MSFVEYNENVCDSKPLSLKDKAFVSGVVLFLAGMLGNEVLMLTDSYRDRVISCVADSIQSSGQSGYKFLIDPRSFEKLSECDVWELSSARRAELFFALGSDGFLDCADEKIDVAERKGYIRGDQDYYRFLHTCYPRYKGFVNPLVQSEMRQYYHSRLRQASALRRYQKGNRL